MAAQHVAPTRLAWPEIQLRHDAWQTLVRHDPTLGDGDGDPSFTAIGRLIGVHRSGLWEVYTGRRELTRNVLERLVALHARNTGTDWHTAFKQLCQVREPARRETRLTAVAA